MTKSIIEEELEKTRVSDAQGYGFVFAESEILTIIKKAREELWKKRIDCKFNKYNYDDFVLWEDIEKVLGG